MARERTGTIINRKGRIYARLTYTGADGKRHDLTRRAADKQNAKRIIRELLTGLEEKGERSIEASRATFADLAQRYSLTKVKPAEYRNGRKIAGMRDHKTVAGYVRILSEHFGSALLRQITAGSIERFRQARLATKTHHGKERSIANVNRTLATLRTMLRFAVAEGWIERSPFEMSHTPMISQSDEVKRLRILSRDEESRLLSACGPDSPRSHLRALVICALDTGMRRGEMMSLEWMDVSLDRRVITVRATNTKTLQARVVPVADRLAVALSELPRSDESLLVFGDLGDCKRSFRTACRIAGISGLRFHDLRATFATRLISAGMQVAEVAKITGHTNLQTLYAHYLRVNAPTLDRAAHLLNNINRVPSGAWID
jgi:integrase